MELYQTAEEYYMARCLQLARLGQGTASPNPMVGAVVLDAKGKKVGEGYHQRAGEAHAEIIALEQAGEAARGGTLYINLEPCNHTGKTPPCTQHVIRSGVDRVVCGTLDPNPLVSGQGRDALQNARISVRHGFLVEECQRLNEAFFHAITTNRPFVTLKLGMTMDGKIAARNRQSRWITNPYSRQYVHHLRSTHDAILTTAETVIADNPALTVRDIPNIQRQPFRMILDRRFRLDPDQYQVFKPSRRQGDTPPYPGDQTWIFTSRLEHNRKHAQRALEKGLRVIEVDETGLGLNLKDVLTHLGEQGITSVLVEAGGQLAGQLVNQELVNKYYLFYGAKLLTDAMALPAFSDGLRLSIADAPSLTIAKTQRLENDWIIEAYPEKGAKVRS